MRKSLIGRLKLGRWLLVGLLGHGACFTRETAPESRAPQSATKPIFRGEVASDAERAKLHRAAGSGVQVKVRKESSDSGIIYRYRIINNGLHPVIALRIGHDYQEQNSELITLPTVWAPKRKPLGNSTAEPSGWTSEWIATEEKASVMLEWSIISTTHEGIAPGSALTGFSVALPREAPEYEGSHFDAILSNSTHVSALITPEESNNVVFVNLEAPTNENPSNEVALANLEPSAAPPRACKVPPLTPLSGPAAEFENGERIDIENLTKRTREAYDCLRAEVEKADGTFELESAFRPADYQRHLREVWSRWSGLRLNKEEQCASLKRTVMQEFKDHELKPSQIPGEDSMHTRGLAFDASIVLPKGTKIDDLAKKCKLRRPLPVTDAEHFELVEPKS